MELATQCSQTYTDEVPDLTDLPDGTHLSVLVKSRKPRCHTWICDSKAFCPQTKKAKFSLLSILQAHVQEGVLRTLIPTLKPRHKRVYFWIPQKSKLLLNTPLLLKPTIIADGTEKQEQA